MSSRAQPNRPAEGQSGASLARPSIGMRSVLKVAIDPSDVGRRVTVRRTLPDEPGRLGDVVGVLEAWEAGSLSIRRRTDERVDVAAATLVAARVVAPEVSSAALQRICAGDSVPDEQTEDNGWLLRAHHGLTRRSSSALALDGAAAATAERVEAVRQWYADRGLRALIVTVEGSQTDADLDRMGLPAELRNDVLVADADALMASLGPVAPVPDVPLVTSDRASERLVHAACPDPARLADFRRLIESVPSARFLALGQGQPIAELRLTPREGWAGITYLEVDPDHRRRGLATRLLGAAAEQARELGHPRLWLQVERDNAVAHALYRQLGFHRHHGYVYRDAS